MKRIALLAAIVCVATACGEENKPLPENTGGAGGGDAQPTAPTFAGIVGAEIDPNDDLAVLIYWEPAVDDLTPAEELTYKLYKWEENPVDWSEIGGGWKEGLNVRETDVTARTASCPIVLKEDGTEGPRCSFSFGGLQPSNAFWFAVEVTDADGMSSGKDLVVPVVSEAGVAPPVLEAPEPAVAAVGGVVRVAGNFLFDEPTAKDALKLDGKPIPFDFIESWSNREILFALPAEYTAGYIEVTTPYGTATSAAALEIQ